MYTCCLRIESETEEEHFSDASEGNKPASPIPITRIEKVDDVPSHGQVPGTAAYDMRSKDAVPDEVEVIPEGGHSRSRSRTGSGDRPSTPRGAPIPITVVEDVDPDSSNPHGMHGAAAHEKHKADAVPDVVLQAPDDVTKSPSSPLSHSESTRADQPIPTTVVTKVDAEPSYGEVPGTDAYAMRTEDAEPDIVEERGDIPGRRHLTLSSTPSERLTESESPTSPLHRSENRTQPHRMRPEGQSPAIADDGGFGPMDYEVATTHEAKKDDGVADDFDDFKEGEGEGDEEFGDFDEGVQQSVAEDSQTNEDAGIHQLLPSTISSFVSKNS